MLEGHTGPLNDMAVAADGSLVVTASEDGTARAWDLVSPLSHESELLECSTCQNADARQVLLVEAMRKHCQKGEKFIHNGQAQPCMKQPSLWPGQVRGRHHLPSVFLDYCFESMSCHYRTREFA